MLSLPGFTTQIQTKVCLDQVQWSDKDGLLATLMPSGLVNVYPSVCNYERLNNLIRVLTDARDTLRRRLVERDDALAREAIENYKADMAEKVEPARGN